MMKKSGFTLAEVLITLGIIGVVAAMTIPTLISSTTEDTLAAQLKKMISSLNQAITMNVAVDSADFSNLGTTAAGTVTGTIYEMFTKRMNIVDFQTSTVTTLGTGPFSASASNYALFFSDGMVVSYPKSATNCAAASATCRFVVDVNGAKKPNKLSTATTTATSIQDQYVFDFYNQQVIPHDTKTKYAAYQ